MRDKVKQLFPKLKTITTGTKKGQAIYIAPLQPTALASVKTWGIQGERQMCIRDSCKGTTFF